MTPTAERLVVRLDVELHPGQRQVHESTARFKVLGCGRRWGKTEYGSLVALFGDENDPRGAVQGYAVWWVAPNYKTASIGWRKIKDLARQIPGAVVYEADRRIEFRRTGGFLEVRSVHDEGSSRGEGLDRIVVDEAAFIDSADRWNKELRPALADKKGSATFLSTFNGENWFYELYELGQDPDEPEWESWRQPTSANPHIDPAEIEAARRTTPKAEFEQEWLANPLVYIGAVFPGEKVQEAVDRGKHREEWLRWESYAGLDWGHNTTSFEVLEEHPTTDEVRFVEEGTWHVMPLGPDPYKEELTKIDLIVDACRRHNILAIYADAAGATENLALAGALEDEGLDTDVVRVPFGKFKDAGITTRRWYLEQDLESMSPECPELIRTTKHYHYKEGSEDVVKEDDHPVDASIAFYASRRGALVEARV